MSVCLCVCVSVCVCVCVSVCLCVCLCVCRVSRAQIKTTVKRKPHSDGGLAVSTDATRKAVKKTGPAGTSPAVHSVPTSHMAAAALRDAPPTQPTIKKQKTADVTLSALNDSDVNSDLVDMEGLGQASNSKKLNNFDQDNLNIDSSLILNSTHLPLLSQ
ncbi:Chromatin complexes subunit BAP18 [Merluccius polli]|uniref:Chromatin complexes subunit BAP18 n=1 Tax=Merluccius polli TaxID=89951 RepID=A0AA47MDI0_MERPO|nr:Chromatin complexes subunit BAP18 [Merluccius polli]